MNKLINNLPLKKKFMVLMIAAMVSYTVSNIFIYRYVLYRSYIDFEQRNAEIDHRRALQAIEREMFHLDRICNDWSSWDDSYSFIVNRNRSFIQHNLNFESFASAGLNLICVADSEKQIVYVDGYDLKSGAKIIPSFFRESDALGKSGILTMDNRVPLHEQKKTSVVLTEYGVMMIAVRHLLTSEGSGPSRGYLIAGRYLNDEAAATLREQTEVNFSVISILDRTVSSENLSMIESLMYGKDRFMMKYDGRYVAVYSLYPDIYGNPAFMLKVLYPRYITAEGFKVTFTGISLMVIGSIIIIMLIWVLLKSSVIKPIAILKEQVKAIIRGEYDYAEVLKSNDELGLLSLVIDDMANTITVQTDELKDMNHKLELMSITDSLTSLYNRRHFDIRIKVEWERACRSGEPLSLIMCDIDFFKKFNDLYGHQAGDDCLKRVSLSLKKSMQRVSDEVYRYGGEEFIVILPNTAFDGALHVARAILRSVSQLGIEHSDSPEYGHVTVSAGVACMIPGKNFSYTDFIGCTDKALYESKNRGRNRISSPESGVNGEVSFVEYLV